MRQHHYSVENVKVLFILSLSITRLFKETLRRVSFRRLKEESVAVE